jgi:F-type H+-transporting ATPase subunit epsilon
MGLHFQLVSASGVKFDAEAYEVVVPTKDGTVAVFEGHMPLLSSGVPGVLSVRKKAGDNDSQMENFAVFGGVLQAEGGNVRFVSEDVSAETEISEKEAEIALERAKKLVESADSHETLREAQTTMHHSEVRLNLARLKKRHHH